MNRPKRILVAVLNWGLGHASRCIPLIEALRENGAVVFLASDGNALALLQREFPDLSALPLPSYHIRYPGVNMVRNMARQLPAIGKAIVQEQRQLSTYVRLHQIDIIISDHRYGCRVAGCRNVFLTHQLNIIIPSPLLQAIVRRLNYALIRRFDECWVPDWPGEENLSGLLGHGHSLPGLSYIGPLSRMKKKELPIKWDIIAVLSGPEPQRTRLEETIIRQARLLSARVLIVRGKVEEQPVAQPAANISCVNYRTGQALNRDIAESEIMLSRSGYSTLMDLVQLQKKAILIPTPGQTEQEYLAQRFMEQKLFYSQEQEEFDLKTALLEVQNYKGFHRTDVGETLLNQAIAKLLARGRI